MRPLSLLLLSLLGPVLPVSAHAQQAGYPVRSPALADPSKKEAQEHFKSGVEHFDRQELSAALAEFLRSRELYPTRSATKNAAVCLRRVGRFDEALEMYEELLRDFSDLAQQDRDFANREIEALRNSIGTIEVRGAEPGAAVVVDGRNRGSYPLAPVRVSVGSHVLRVAKDGLPPFEARVDVAGQQAIAVDVHFAALPGSSAPSLTQRSEREPAHHDVALPTAPPDVAPSAARRSAKFVFEIASSYGLAPVFGGDVISGCVGSCNRGSVSYVRANFRAGYEASVGVGFTADAGYLGVSTSPTGRQTEILPVGRPANPGTVNDDLRLFGLMVGASMLLHSGNAWPLSFRVGGGALIATMRDGRAGSFTNSLGDQYPINLAREDSALYAYVAPELRVGKRLWDHIELSLGIEATILVSIRQPRFSTNILVSTGNPNSQRDVRGDGQGLIPGGESLAGELIIGVAPSLSLRCDF